MLIVFRLRYHHLQISGKQRLIETHERNTCNTDTLGVSSYIPQSHETTRTNLLTIDIAGITEISLACDSTGLRIADASHYYEQRAKKKVAFVRLHVMMETNTRAIISAEITDPKTGDVTVLKEKFLQR